MLPPSPSTRSDCRKVYDGQQGRSSKTPTMMKCVFCDEDIKPIWEAMKEHSEVCGPGNAAAAARVAAVAVAAQKQHQQQKELQQQLQQQQQHQQPGQTRQGSAIDTNNGVGRPGLSGSVSGSSEAATSAAGLVVCCSSHEGGSNNDGTTTGRGGRASPSPPPPLGQLLPPKLKRRNSTSNNNNTTTFGRRGSTGSSPSSLLTDRQRSAESFSSYSGRALGSDSDSSDSDFEGGMGGGGLGGGTGGSGTSGSVLGATRRPMPPKKRWETEFEAWAKGGEGYNREVKGEGAGNVGVKGGFVGVAAVRQGGIGKDNSIGVEKRYPCLMDRAGDSALVTVREVRRVKLGGEGGDGLAKSESGEECEAVVECSMVVSRGKVDVSEIAVF